MNTVTLEVPQDIVFSLKIPPGEIKEELTKELALALYVRGVLPLGKARQFAGMTRRGFHEELGQRRIIRHYTEEDFEEDLVYARSDR